MGNGQAEFKSEIKQPAVSLAKFSLVEIIKLSGWFLGLIVLDQVTKQAVLNQFVLGESRSIIDGFFSLTFVLNRGVAFGMFADHEPNVRLILLGLSAFVALGVLVYVLLESANDWFARRALVFVLAGAVGNLADRIRIGAVVDFFDFYIGSFHWPAFNVADSAIFIGVAVLILRGSKNDTETKAASKNVAGSDGQGVLPRA